MKKLVLIDDNHGNQREAYGASYVDEGAFSNVLIHIEKVNGDSDFSFLDNAECVMMHFSLEDYVDGSFIPEGRKAKERIEEIIDKRDMNHVIFSDGGEEHVDIRNGKLYSTIMKKVFYRNLKDFLEQYSANGELDMNIIAYGKDYSRKIVNNKYLSLIEALRDYQDQEVLNLDSLNKENIGALDYILDKSQPEINITFNELMAIIEDGNITIGSFRANVNNIISDFLNYGECISSWKK